MSNVKIKGNASGTGNLTIEAPNTNTDRTITLPDETGTLVHANSEGAVSIVRDNTGTEPYIQLTAHNTHTSAGIALSTDVGQKYEMQSTPSDEFIVYCRDTNTYAMRINPQGHIRSPQLPYWAGYLNTDIAQNNTRADITNFNTTQERGNHFSNGVFTCPVDGLYEITCYWIKYPQSGAAHVDLEVNGAVQTQYRWRGEETATYCQVGGSCYRYCSANDTLNWSYFGGAGIHNQNGHWGIRLIG